MIPAGTRVYFAVAPTESRRPTHVAHRHTIVLDEVLSGSRPPRRRWQEKLRSPASTNPSQAPEWSRTASTSIRRSNGALRANLSFENQQANVGA